MTVSREILPTLDPIAFVGALVLAPVLVALLFFWMLLIPVFAIIFGGVPYLVFGTPILLWMVTRYPLDADHFALGGVAALALFAIALTVANRIQPNGIAQVGSFFLFWGIPFAMGWFITFALLYRRFWRPIVR